MNNDKPLRVEGVAEDGDVRYVPQSGNRYTFCSAAHFSRYAWATKLLRKNQIILDAGCGSGYGTHYLAKKGVKKIVGVDKSKNVINWAKDKYRRRNLDFYIMDLCALGFKDETFNLIISFDVIEHVLNCDLYLSEITRVLRRGSTFIIGTPNKEQTLTYNKDWNPFHIKEFSPNELKTILKSHFDEVTMFGQQISGENKRRRFLNALRTTNSSGSNTPLTWKQSCLGKTKQFVKKLLAESITRNKLTRTMCNRLLAIVSSKSPPIFYTKDMRIVDMQHHNLFGLVAICKKSLLRQEKEAGIL